MIKIASLWKRQGAKGQFLAGKIGDASIMIFPNTQKNQPNQPDYNVFIAEDKRPKTDAPRKPKPNPQQYQQRSQGHMPPAPPLNDAFSEFPEEVGMPGDGDLSDEF